MFAKATLSSSSLLTLFFPIFSTALPQNTPVAVTYALPTSIIQPTIKNFQFTIPADEISNWGVSPQIKGYINLTLTDTLDSSSAIDCSADLSANEIGGNNMSLTSVGGLSQFYSDQANQLTQEFIVPDNFFTCAEGHFNFWFIQGEVNLVRIAYSHT
jgi:hypothetical protein